MDRPETNLFHMGTYPVECFYGGVCVDCKFKHTLFNILYSISKTILINHFLNHLKIKRIMYGRKSIGGVNTNV